MQMIHTRWNGQGHLHELSRIAWLLTEHITYFKWCLFFLDSSVSPFTCILNLFLTSSLYHCRGLLYMFFFQSLEVRVCIDKLFLVSEANKGR